MGSTVGTPVKVGALLCLASELFARRFTRGSLVLLLAIVYVLHRSGTLAKGAAIPPWLTRLLTSSFLLGLGISILIYILPNPASGLGAQFNSLLSRRVAYTQAAIDTYGISPWEPRSPGSPSPSSGPASTAPASTSTWTAPT